MSKNKVRDARGSIEWVMNAAGGCWHARVSLPGSVRLKVKLETVDGRSLDNKDRDALLARDMAAALSEQLRAKAAELKRDAEAPITVQQFGERWTSGELYQLHGEIRKLKPKASAKDDASRLRAHVYPHIGAIAVAAVTEVMIEQCLAQAARIAEARRGRPWRAATKLQVYQVMHRLFDLSIKPGRLRSDNPVSEDLRPGRDAPKIFSYLYPTELLQLLGCTAVPLARRVYYAVACYTGLRLGSLYHCTWNCIDFTNVAITSLKNKNQVPLIFAQADRDLPGLQTLMTILERWFAYQGMPARRQPIVSDLGCPRTKEAAALRADLQRAGIDRAQLFERSQYIEPLRFHDLRATFITWARRAGKDSGWISDRSGHLTPSMLQRYDRGARSLNDLQIMPFPDITDAIPELRNVRVLQGRSPKR